MPPTERRRNGDSYEGISVTPVGSFMDFTMDLQCQLVKIIELALWPKDTIAFDQRRHPMNIPEKIKQILLSEIEKMNQHRADFCKRPGKDFTRVRKISFPSILHF